MVVRLKKKKVTSSHGYGNKRRDRSPRGKFRWNRTSQLVTRLKKKKVRSSHGYGIEIRDRSPRGKFRRERTSQLVVMLKKKKVTSSQVMDTVSRLEIEVHVESSDGKEPVSWLLCSRKRKSRQVMDTV